MTAFVIAIVQRCALHNTSTDLYLAHSDSASKLLGIARRGESRLPRICPEEHLHDGPLNHQSFDTGRESLPKA
jgi:hypothetical protein